MQFQRYLVRGISIVCCLCLMLPLLSSVAFAAEAGGAILFAEAYGLEIADGETKSVKFQLPGYTSTQKLTNTTTMEELVKKLSFTLPNFGYTPSYDKDSGQLVITDNSGAKVDFKVLADGEELIFKPSLSTPSISGGSTTMAQLLSTITDVFAVSIGWIAAVSNAIVSNPILLLIVVIGFIGAGVSFFKRLLNL